MIAAENTSRMILLWKACWDVFAKKVVWRCWLTRSCPLGSASRPALGGAFLSFAPSEPIVSITDRCGYAQSSRVGSLVPTRSAWRPLQKSKSFSPSPERLECHPNFLAKTADLGILRQALQFSADEKQERERCLAVSGSQSYGNKLGRA